MNLLSQMLLPVWRLEVLRGTSYFVHWTRNWCGCVLASYRTYIFYVRFISVKTLSQSSSIQTQGNKKMEVGKTLVINISPLSPLRIAQWGVVVKRSRKWSGAWKQSIFSVCHGLYLQGQEEELFQTSHLKLGVPLKIQSFSIFCHCYCFYFSHHPECKWQIYRMSTEGQILIRY